MYFPTLRKYIQRAEELLLCAILLLLVVLACLQIVLRLFFDSGLIWADPLLRYLTLWGGMLGAVLAVSQEKHISLDILNNFIGKQLRKYLKIINWSFCTIVCGFLSYASWRFIQDEFAFGGSAILTIPSWVWNLIFPLGFGIMMLRYFVGTIFQVLQLGKPKTSTLSGQT